MRSSNKQIRTAYKTILTGSVTYTGTALKIYSIVPDNAETPFIIIGNQQQRHGEIKSGKEIIATISISVVQRFNNKEGSLDVIDDLIDTIYQLIFPSSDCLTVDNFQLITGRLQNDSTSINQNDVGLIITRTLTIEHKLHDNY